jgi:predicted transcriptional regulator
MKRPVNPEETHPRTPQRDRAKPATGAGSRRISAETSVNAITDITCAYLANPNNSTSLQELPQVIQTVQDHVRNLIATVSDSVLEIDGLIGLHESAETAAEPVGGRRGDDNSGLKPPGEPAVPINQSITDDYLFCLEDGKRFKTLRRHLERCYGLTPEQYRQRWGLPSDYPMTSPNYHATRSRLAHQNGFGRSEPPAPEKPKPTGRGRARGG